MPMAIKTVSIGKESETFRKEVDLLRSMVHENIVQLYGCLQVKEKLWILMDLCEMGSAMDVLKRQPGRIFSEGVILAILFPVLKGLAYLHSRNVIHRDIKVTPSLFHLIFYAYYLFYIPFLCSITFTLTFSF